MSESLWSAAAVLPADGAAGALVGRILDETGRPRVVAVNASSLVDVTDEFRTTADLFDEPDPAGAVRTVLKGGGGRRFDSTAVFRASVERSWTQAESPLRRTGEARLLAPIDLQVIKAAGVTFALSMVERVIEEQAKGDPARAAAIRGEIGAVIGGELKGLRPGSPEAAALKAHLQARGLWSQYLEVGIGPDAEIFTKAPVLSAVGTGADVGLHPVSTWNNPEPEVVLVVSSRGRIVGATLGNDVNLRDVEGRSALLLGKAKDNNASAAIGPFVRLFDETFTLDHVRAMKLRLRVEGEDGFTLDGASDMSAISRDPEDLVAQAYGAHHQYPDGFVLYCGTLFAPTQDRGAPGAGFTHRLGDRVAIASAELGTLVNRVRLSTECPPWEMGIRAFFRA